MPSRRLFCVNDPTHADFTWEATSRFRHIRKYDACGNTTAQWTFPVTGTEAGDMTCAVCGGSVYVAGAPAEVVDDVVACDILGRCQSAPLDANQARLDALAAALAKAQPGDRARLAPAVAALIAAVAGDPVATTILDRHNLKEIYTAG